MMNRLLQCLFFSCLAVAAVAQTRLPQDNVSNSFSPSPNASHSGYGESLGADPFTGRLQAGFTLFSYQSKSSGLSHSITLNYQGGGITVDQMAGNCGLGWSLSAGGVITRTIQGVPDENGELGFQTPGISTPLSFDSVVFTAIANDLYDGEYDIYGYSAGSAGGQFIIGKTGNIATIPSSKIKIEKINNGYHPTAAPLDSCVSLGFKLTLENGIQYFYSNFDCSKLEYNNESPFLTYASSTWYLSKIVSAFDKDTIYFDYTPVVQNYIGGFSFVNYAKVGTAPQDNFNSNQKYTNRVRDMRLSTVRYPNGTTVTFNYDAFKRIDYKTDNAIKDITISNQFTASTYSYKFAYSYINRGLLPISTPTIAYQNYSGDPIDANNEVKSSLQLDSIYEIAGTDRIPGYSFEYSGPNLPERGYSSRVDHWGFYSYASGNRIPGLPIQGINMGVRQPGIRSWTGRCGTALLR